MSFAECARPIQGSRIETQLAPTLAKGDVVILDNLAVHKSARAAECLKDRGGVVPVPAALQSGSQPIEMAFAKLKAHLRAAVARTFDALWKALGKICDLFNRTGYDRFNHV